MSVTLVAPYVMPDRRTDTDAVRDRIDLRVPRPIRARISHQSLRRFGKENLSAYILSAITEKLERDEANEVVKKGKR